MKLIRETELKSMCINTIVKHIDLYVKPNEAIETFLEYLKRCFSDRLFNLLERKTLFPETYLEFLLTPHWKNVSMSSCIDYSFTRLMSKFQIMGQGITSLNLENSTYSVDMLSAVICCVPNITSLNLRWTYCNDVLLALIKKMCISLASLNISNCKNISDAGMVNLCNTNNEDSGFNSLKTLNIIQTAVTRQGVITLLRHLRSLHWLYYKDLSKILYNLHKSDFENNPIRYNLKYFEYNRERVALRKMLEVWAVMCPFVTRISIQDKITNVDLELCKRFQNLKKFKITSINYHPRGIIISPFISVKGAMLTELKVMYATVSVETIVKSCPNLKQLFLFNVTFEVFSLTDLNNGNYVLDNMASLTVKHFDFGRDLLAFDSIYLLIKSSKYLNELCIQYIEGFTDVLADIILELPYLSVVDLSFTDIKNSTLFRFLIREHITQMSVDGCPDVSLDDNSINKLISENQSGNTCSWVIDYSEMACESMWDYSMWSGEIYM